MLEILIDGEEVDAAIGLKKSARHQRVRDGLLTRPIKWSPRCARWPSSEIEAIQRALIAGATDDEIRSLVTRLHAKRVDEIDRHAVGLPVLS
jgi:prophage regulatory protein